MGGLPGAGLLQPVRQKMTGPDPSHCPVLTQWASMAFLLSLTRIATYVLSLRPNVEATYRMGLDFVLDQSWLYIDRPKVPPETGIMPPA